MDTTSEAAIGGLAFYPPEKRWAKCEPEWLADNDDDWIKAVEEAGPELPDPQAKVSDPF